MRGRDLLRRFHGVLPQMFLVAVFVVLELAHGKVYDRCELARELKFVHKAPDHQLATWVCIAEHESGYNTSIVGHLNGDGSGDHGLFQISDQFWCSPPGNGLACGVTCAELEDDDITDDFICAQRIYREHKQLSGDGFNAWAVYEPHCKGPKADSYLKGCFDVFEGPKTFTTPAPIAAHGFFNTASGRPSKEAAAISTQTTTSAPFLSFGSLSALRNQEVTTARPAINSFFQNNRFFTPTESPRSDFFTPTTTFKPAFGTRTTFAPTRTTSTRGLVVFNSPATTQSTNPTTRRPAAFDFGRMTSRRPAAFDFGSTTSRRPAAFDFGSTTSKRPAAFDFGSTTSKRPAAFDFGSTTSRKPAAFDFGRPTSTLSTTAPFAPTTRSSAFSQSTTVARPRPVFIINGVKWY